MRCICRLCGEIHRDFRSAHLRDKHGIDSSYKGAVKDYFLEPEEVGLSREMVKIMPEGSVVGSQAREEA